MRLTVSVSPMKFWKYHALGNDYIVIDPKDLEAPFGLRIYNPDGSEAEKSGNGLRIFSRCLWDRKLVGEKEFAIETPGGVVKSTVFENGEMVRVEMGKVTFWSDEIPVSGPR